MFAEYLKNETWQSIMPGVSSCSFIKTGGPGPIPARLEYGFSEAFFCTGGAMTLVRKNGVQLKLCPKEILLLADLEEMESAEIGESLEGIVISVDRFQAGDSLRELSSRFVSMSFSMKTVGDHLTASGGIRVVPISPWTRAAFYAMQRLPEEKRGAYCVMKVFELLYLICAQSPVSQPCDQPGCGNLMSVASGMKAYMEEHMDEKLTITDLSHQFHLSRTACKSAFRSCFGQPIHSWLLDRRMERAADLLERTRMPILQVAQSVGYTGVSQFNVAFRQRYGKSPREYRKMSVPGSF